MKKLFILLAGVASIFACKKSEVAPEKIRLAITLENTHYVEFEYWSSRTGMQGFYADAEDYHLLVDTLRAGDVFTMHFRGEGLIYYHVLDKNCKTLFKGSLTAFETKTFAIK